MKNYIERYVYDVSRRLPDTIKEDVSQDLTAQIYDMLGEKYTDEAVEKTLKSLGRPRELAAKYRTKERYLISPRLIDQYLIVLKIVLIIMGIIGLVGGILNGISDLQNTLDAQTIAAFFGKTIGSVINGMIMAFAWVTVIFAIFEYNNVNLDEADWKLKDLPELPKLESLEIKKVSTFVGLVFSVTLSSLFVLFLSKWIELIAWYEDGQRIVSFFNESAVRIYIPFFVLSIIGSVVTYTYLLLKGRWEIKTLLAYSVYEVLSLVLIIVFVLNTAIVNPDFIAHMATVFETTYNTSKMTIKHFGTGISVVSSLLVFLDVGSLWYKVIKHKKTVHL